MELIKTKQKTLSNLNVKIMEIIEEEDIDEEIEEVDRYELDIQLRYTQLMSTQFIIRELLRQSSAIYDPLGPITFRAKILIQEVWKKGYAWDGTLPKEIKNAWTDVKNDILQITSKLKLQRYYFANNDEETSESTLRILVDASQKAYGASVYFNKGTVSTKVIAKNRVAPLKVITLPKWLQ
ncbi:unnamed protein product [Mytilus coruscus]|uniref:Reverse transcriptase/retrotransposon-derived protein RNase H-like domain-containing protein n=1 Tax=Mytilus coruscus TaxID=42192 RepID=A0A6J8EUE3_MYTCO|nr:unnamed protein product [Mytilus coruscus]